MEIGFEIGFIRGYLIFAGYCPPGWKNLNGTTCYYFSGDQKSWTQAESFCRNIRTGSKLAEPKDPNTNKILYDAAVSRIYGSMYWIGIKEVGSSWKWASDGSTVAWINWNPGEPGESKIRQRCVVMWVGNGEKRWDQWCTGGVGYYICEL